MDKLTKIKVGDSIGKWTVLKYSGLKITGDYISKDGKRKEIIKQKVYTCKCLCGAVKDVYEYNLRSGRSSGCKVCSDILKRKDYENLSRERKRQLMKVRMGKCIRACSEPLFRNCYCEKHYRESLEYQKRRYAK
jgi:hypothetical protein